MAAALTTLAPTSATFAYPDAAFGDVTGVLVEYFLCTLVSGVWTPAPTPFQPGTVIPKANVTGPATARVIDLTAAPASAGVATLPTGSVFIATLAALGDPAQGFGSSPRSAASNPFFARPASPAVPGVPLLQ